MKRSSRPIWKISILITVCLIPMGLETPSVGPQIAECQKVLEASGLEYKVSSDTGLTVELC